MTHKIVRRKVQPHECDVDNIRRLAEVENLGTGSVIRCERCGQRWLWTRNRGADLSASSMKPIDLLDYMRIVFGGYS